MSQAVNRTAEHVGAGHPDKFCDQVADRLLDTTLQLCGDVDAHRCAARTAIECLAKNNLLQISGETTWPEPVAMKLLGLAKHRVGDKELPVDVVALARDVWRDVGYGTGEELAVLNHICPQSPDIAKGDGEGGVDLGGAGDQGIMVGYATDETHEMMPREWLLARNICRQLRQQRIAKTLPWLASDDCKSQVTINSEGRISNVIIAVHHTDVDVVDLRKEVFAQVVRPILEEQGATGAEVWDKKGRFKIADVHGAINGTGKFTIGGPLGDAGVVGRKIVVDAYGPRVPVGGGAYSGKDPTKVDRSAAYMARHIAKAVVAHQIGGAKECLVQIAYGIGQLKPEMVTAVTDRGEDVGEWVKAKFPDLEPTRIIEYLGLRRPDGWSYSQSAAYGHYGRSEFPWEKVANV